MVEPSPKKQSTQGHYKRLRERFFKAGLDGFQEYEIVELLLMMGQTRTDRKEQAKAAIKRFKGLLGVLEASPEELQEIAGIGPASVFGIKLVREAGELYLKERAQKNRYCGSSQEVYDYLYQSMRGLKKEVFKVLFLDSKNKLLKIEDLFSGTINASAVFPREVVASAIKYHAAALIFVHNHPSGNPAPSQEDRDITRDLVRAAGTIQVKVLDHIIIGDNQRFSFTAEGLLARYEAETPNGNTKS
jgi:DNA repair protein RadC